MSLRALAFVVFAAGCGASQTQTQTAPPPPPPAARESDTASSGGMTLEGQLGYLSQEQLTGVLGPATSQLAGCYNDRLQEHGFLAGRVELKIRIGADGAPRWVIPLNSTVGDRPTEQCMIDRAMALRFPPPRGGETETRFPLEFEGGEDARPATEWPASRVEHALGQHRAALAQCTHGVAGPYDITLYAAPHGAVATAGVSVPTVEAAAAVECLLHEVTSWHLPDPGSYYAKATVHLD